MSNLTPIVETWNVNTSEFDYDLFIAAIGYEKRCNHIAETLPIQSARKMAIAFPSQKVLNYEKNLKWFSDRGFVIAEEGEAAFRYWCERTFFSLKSDAKGIVKIAIDISSFDRFRIAVLVDVIRTLEWATEVRVDFLYSVAKFSAPPSKKPTNRIVGPVLPSFAGWSLEPEKPPVAIVGLGYEEDKALGAVEHVQAASIWSMIPVSNIKRYRAVLEKANVTLLEAIPENQRLEYRVEQPLDCFIKLESITNRLLQKNSPILFPFGPKIFTVCTLLVGCLYSEVAVWRVSAGSELEAIDRKASGEITGISVTFSRSYENG